MDSNFSTNLLREKFTIIDPRARTEEARQPIIALSNRLHLVLSSKEGTEVYSVRAQNMHLSVRFAARIIRSFRNSGPIMNRETPFDWGSACDAIISDYEHTYNPNYWISVHHEGKLVFEKGERHILLDVIEKCAKDNGGNYDDAVPLAEDIFKQAGKDVNISYDGNVALVVEVKDNKGRFGIILRGAERSTTFNFTAKGNEKTPDLSIPHCLEVSAAYLEGIQLAFLVGMNQEKLRMGIIDRDSDEDKKTVEARRRLGRLTTEISSLEAIFDVRYRPEKPEFSQIITEAEELARDTLEKPTADE